MKHKRDPVDGRDLWMVQYVSDLVQDGFAADPATGDQLRFAAVHRPEQSILPATVQWPEPDCHRYPKLPTVRVS